MKPSLSGKHARRGHDNDGCLHCSIPAGRECFALTLVFVVGVVQWIVVICLWKVRPAELSMGEAHGLVPDFGTKVVRFNSTREDGARAMNDLDQAWTNIMPVGSGFVVVDGSDKFSDSLPPPMKLNGDQIFSVAVFHQLHCLHYMLKEFNKLLEPNMTIHDGHDYTVEAGHNHGKESHEEALKHVGHCFDYLRNSLMCCGDVAFEGQGSDVEGPGTLGEASYHVCKNYERIKDWAQAKRATSMEGFSD